NDTYGENVLAFANTINTVDGGTHLSGFRSALTRSINNFASSTGMLKEQKDEVSISGDDVREGLVAVVSVRLPQPQFEGQTKGKLNSDSKGDVEQISASSPEYGEAKESIEKEYKGEPIAIGFNSSYMLDFLGAAADGPISIELKDEQSAGQMRPLADESYRYRYIIMPMRI